VSQELPQLQRTKNKTNNNNKFGDTLVQGISIASLSRSASVQGSVLSPLPALIAAQDHMMKHRTAFIAAKRIQDFLNQTKKGKKGGDPTMPTKTNVGQDQTKLQGQQGESTAEPTTVDPPTLSRVSEPTVLTQPPEIIRIPVVRPNLDITSWKKKPQDPLRQFKPKKLVNQPVIRLGHRRAILQFKTQVDIKITVPKAIKRGGQSRAEVALESIQRKYQALLKAMKETRN
jgi:hypothetical protein